MNNDAIDPQFKIIKDPTHLQIDDPILIFHNSMPSYGFVHHNWEEGSSTIKVILLDEEVVDADINSIAAVLIDYRCLLELGFVAHQGYPRYYSMGEILISDFATHDHTQIFFGLTFIESKEEFEKDIVALTAKQLGEKYSKADCLHLLERRFKASHADKGRFMHNVLALMNKFQG